MTRTEDDVRTLYHDDTGADDVERRIVAWIKNPDSTMTAPAATSNRRWIAPVASAAAVAAAVVALAIIVPSLNSGPRSDGVGTKPVAPLSTGPSANADPVTTSVPAPATVPITPQVALQTLLGLLPGHGSASSFTGRTGLGWTGSEAVYNDGHGAARIAVAVNYPFTGTDGTLQRVAAGSLCPSVTDGDPCTTEPDGSQVTVYQGTEFTHPAHGSKDWEIRLLRTDGVEIDITQWNAATEKATTTTRIDPPFTIAQLTTIAQSPQWQATVSATAADQAASLFVADPPVE